MTKETSLTDVMSIYLGWIKEDLIEDRLEYCLTDFQKAYPDLDEVKMTYLLELLNDHRGGQGIINMNYPGELIKEMLGEACHQGLDGWTETEQATITAFLRDIGLACNLSQ
jgi:hypothetical protein